MKNILKSISFTVGLSCFVLGANSVQAQTNCPEANLSLVLNAYTSYNSCVDFNNDGVVNAKDLAIFLGDGHPAPTLLAGSGFVGETPQPPVQGSPTHPRYDTKSIGRWNFVPAQRLSNAFNIGVVAFSAGEIDRVEFSLDGGPFTAISKMRLNQESNTKEYFVRIDPSQLSTGKHEVRAIIYPKQGQPRVLAGALAPASNANYAKGEYSIFFVADPNNSLPQVQKYVSPNGSDTKGNGSVENPFQSIMKAVKAINTESGGKADGGIVNLLPGNHHYGTYSYGYISQTVDSFLTIRPAPGVASSDAPIVSASLSGLNISHVRFQNVTFQPLPANNTNLLITTASGALRAVWVDGCNLLGVGRTNPTNWAGGWTHGFVTDTFITQSANGLNGQLVRNVSIGVIGSDAFSGAGMVINSTVQDIDESGTDFHADFFQLYSGGPTLENHILYNAKMLQADTTQGVFAGNNVSIKDIAFVDVRVDTRDAFYGFFLMAFQYAGPTKHLYLQDSEILGPAIFRTDYGFDGDDVVFKNTNFLYGVPVCNIPDRCDITVIE